MEKKVKATPVKKSTKQLSVVDLIGKEVGSIQLPSDIFEVTSSEKLLSLYVRVYLNNQKQVGGSTKTRSQVQGSTRKIYRQKGTGRARHGANTAPIFVGGGIAHGPRGIIKKLHINKKQRTKALYVALSKAIKEKRMHTVLDAAKIDGSTKQLQTSLNTISPDTKVLVVYAGAKEPMIGRAGKNLELLRLSQAETLNAYHVLSAASILFTKLGLEQFIKQRRVN